jgi:hypothetical protein
MIEQPSTLRTESTSELSTVNAKTFRYPALYRVVALLGALLFGLIMLGSAIATVVALKNGRSDVVLYLFGLISGVLMLVVGLDFATRSITVTPAGLQVSWLLHRSAIAWPDVLGWNYLPLSLIHLRLQHGRGVVVWPLLEDYLDLLSAIDAQRLKRLTP